MFGSLIDWFSIASITLRPDGSGGVETGPWLFAPRVSNIELGRLSLAFGMDQERVESSRWSGTPQVSSYRFDRTSMNIALETRFGPARRFYYTVEPLMELRYSYTDFIGLAGFSRSPLSFGIRQSIFYNSVDTFHNSRKGIRSGVSGTLKMVQTDGIWRPVAELRGEAGVYITFDKRGRFSFYPRFLVFSVFNDTAEKTAASPSTSTKPWASACGSGKACGISKSIPGSISPSPTAAPAPSPPPTTSGAPWEPTSSSSSSASPIWYFDSPGDSISIPPFPGAGAASENLSFDILILTDLLPAPPLNPAALRKIKYTSKPLRRALNAPPLPSPRKKIRNQNKISVALPPSPGL